MSVSLPSAPSVLHQRGPGRKPATETALQVIEGAFYGAGTEAIYGRENLRAARPHDERADDAVRQMREVGRRLTRHADDAVREQGYRIIALADVYDREDGQEDARVTHGEYRFGMVLTEVQIGCHSIEMTETGQGRHRPAPRPTDARQMELDGEGGGGCL